MGQSSSYPSTQQCAPLTNDEIAFRTKQFIVIIKIVQILDAIKDNKVSEDIIQNPLKYIVDVHKILYDIYQGDMTGISAQIFGTNTKATGISNGTPYSTPDTILHEYNAFIISQFPVMSGQDRVVKARDLYERLLAINTVILNSLQENCLLDFGAQPVV